ncbi:MAG: fused MFS/spermidine synthase [Planctomycetota bacterium]|jgi:spermidine synthase
MNKPKNLVAIAGPSITVFLSSACIMVLELVAGRLIARHLGSSLYTWTSVIGVVLAGISIGNYLGGRIADRCSPRKALAVLFAVSSATCVAIVVLNNLVGDWMLMWYLRWPLRVFTHVCLVFLVPSTMLGTISPVVAKMALDRGLPIGRTVGDIYAWGAAGSIAGTFFAGFYLIAAMGTIAIIWVIGAVLLSLAILYWAGALLLYLWAAVFIVLATTAMTPAAWARRAGAALALRKKPDPRILYEDESQYNYIAVKQVSTAPEKRHFLQDALIHSRMTMNNIEELEYPYEQVYAALTHQLSREKKKLSVLMIGGGGYVFPRYIEKFWPGSRIDVVEIDAGVTKAAVEAFGLEPDTSINTIIMDARNYLDGLAERQRLGRDPPRYDFVYGDAFNHYSVPYQLVTREFNNNIARILAEDGVYMINLIDMLDTGLFIGSFVNTMKQTFRHVYVVAQAAPDAVRNTFVVIGANRKINLDELKNTKQIKTLDLWVLSDSDMETLDKKGRGIILTDDYVPVENMLAPAVSRGAADSLIEKLQQLAQNLKKQGKFDKSIAAYKELLKARPEVWIYREIASMIMAQGRSGLEEAADVLQSAWRAFITTSAWR